MITDLRGYLTAALDTPVPAAVRAVAARLAETPEAAAVLFYGSNLRTGSLDGVLDFYVLIDGPPERGLWPHVGYRELDVEGVQVRAKVAAVSLPTFKAAASGDLIDTTIWTRFVQPAALVWSRDADARRQALEAVMAAAMTAARYAAALGGSQGRAEDYWRGLFRRTYAAEFRVEKAGREEQILEHDRNRYRRLLPLAWKAAGIAFTKLDERLFTHIQPQERRDLQAAWVERRRWGKPLNVARLARAAFTFDGAAAYGLWKVERHTGVAVPLTPWRERHPILAAPGVLWRVWRARRAPR